MTGPPKVEQIGTRPCPSGHGQVRVIRITTTVPGTKPVEMGYCPTCSAAVA